MGIHRRDFLKISAGAAGAAFASVSCVAQKDKSPAGSGQDMFSELRPMTADVVHISDEERQGRVEKARRLMVANGIQAVYMESCHCPHYCSQVSHISWIHQDKMVFAAAQLCLKLPEYSDGITVFFR